MSDYHNKIFDSIEALYHDADYLAAMSVHSHAVGLERLGDNLLDVANSVRSSVKNINNAIGEESSYQLQKSRRNAAETLKLVLDHTLNECPISWKDILDHKTDILDEVYIEDIAQMAKKLKYSHYIWNDRLYETNNAKGPKDAGWILVNDKLIKE